MSAPQIATDEWETFKRGKWGIFHAHWLTGEKNTESTSLPWQAMKAGTVDGWQGFTTHEAATDYVRSKIDSLRTSD